MTINVLIKQMGNRPLYYPNDPLATCILQVARKKAFSKKDIDLLRSGGCVVEVTAMPFPEEVM